MNRLQYFIGTICACLIFGVCSINPAISSELAKPTNDVVLTVSGDIKATNGGAAAAFDIAMLESIGVQTFETSTIWTDGVQTFTGVELRKLLEVFDIKSGTLKASAINDYAVEIPVSDAVVGGPIIAYRKNGEEMGVRNKGPLWIVYPYDDNPVYQTELIYSRSIWQLDRIEVLP